MTQELVLLGILAGGPLHGYEVCKAIEEKLTPVVGLQPRSVYYSLKKLEKEGFVSSRPARTGRRPRKLVYRLRARGRRELKRLLIANVELLQRPYMNVDLSLFFMQHVDHSACEDALKKRLKALLKVAGTDFGSILDKCGLAREECMMKIAEHNSAMLKAEIAFTRRLLAEVRREQREKKKTARRRVRRKRPS
jgi:DNA-binding PadR family transcriptional regulator